MLVKWAILRTFEITKMFVLILWHVIGGERISEFFTREDEFPSGGGPPLLHDICLYSRKYFESRDSSSRIHPSPLLRKSFLPVVWQPALQMHSSHPPGTPPNSSEIPTSHPFRLPVSGEHPEHKDAESKQTGLHSKHSCINHLSSQFLLLSTACQLNTVFWKTYFLDFSNETALSKEPPPVAVIISSGYLTTSFFSQITSITACFKWIIRLDRRPQWGYQPIVEQLALLQYWRSS